jgi:hypothetical protein
MTRTTIAAVLAAAVLAGCGTAPGREDQISQEVEKSVQDAETRARESRTMSALAKLEEAIAAYIGAEKRIPDSIEELIPKYLAEVPSVEIDARGHHDNNAVRKYPASILMDGQIDGSQLKDSGRWGYVHNDRQVVIFIDCTHQSRRGHPWYMQHGVF